MYLDDLITDVTSFSKKSTSKFGIQVEALSNICHPNIMSTEDITRLPYTPKRPGISLWCSCIANRGTLFFIV